MNRQDRLLPLLFRAGLVFATVMAREPAKAQPGALDPGFYRNAVFDDYVTAAALQADGKVVVGGYFLSVSGYALYGIARLHAHGGLDHSFNPGGGLEGNLPVVYSIAIYPGTSGTNSGKIVIAGSFTHYDGIARRGIARLNTDGTLDTSYDPGTGLEDGDGFAVAIQSDGKVMVGGSFTVVQGVSRPFIARFHANGSLDTGFNPGSGPDNSVFCLAVQPDGKVLIGGAFLSVQGWVLPGIARLTSTGALDSFAAFDPGDGAQGGEVASLALQSDNKIVIGGYFTSYDGAARRGVARLNPNGTLDTTFAPSPGVPEGVDVVLAAGSGRVLIGGSFTNVNGTLRHRIARLNNNGSTDATFNPGEGADDAVLAMTLQTDGRVVLAGAFNTVDGWSRGGVARLTTTGAVDTGFNQTSGTDGPVYAVAAQADGRLLLAGEFAFANDALRYNVARLTNNGLLDPTFNPGSGTDGAVAALAVYTNGPYLGQIVLGGPFTDFNGTACSGLIKLLSSGTLDATFAPPVIRDASVFALALQPDHKILIGGSFTNVNGVSRPGVARLNVNGTLDGTFNPGSGISGGGVNAVAIYPAATGTNSGKIIIAGAFTQFNGVPRNNVARLDTAGALDTSFDPGSGVEDGAVYAALVQPDGRVLVGGNFTTVRGMPRSGLARFHADGSLDTGFDPGAGVGADTVWTLSLQTNGQILVGGSFTNYNGIACRGLARVNGDGSFDWGFDVGAGVAGGDEAVYGLALQPDGKVMVGGSFVTYDDFACWNVARVLGGAAVPTAPYVVSQPADWTGFAGETAFFSVRAGGSRPLSYQWWFNGLLFTDATNAFLDLPYVTPADEGYYFVTISNAHGAVTSAVATLTVLPSIDLGVALDAPHLGWATGNERVWHGQPNVTHDGVDAAESGWIGDNEFTWMETIVTGPGRVSFWWKVSSEAGYDFLRFFVGDSLQAEISGDVDWTNQTFAVPAGEVSLYWEYVKDESLYSGDDLGWVDQVQFIGPPRLEVSAPPAGRPFQLTVQAAPGQPVTILASTNLTDWVPVDVLPNPTGTAVFSDPTWTNVPARFYRAQVP